jgi:hypothetical protein
MQGKVVIIMLIDLVDGRLTSCNGIILSKFTSQIGFAKSCRVEVDASIPTDSSRGVPSCMESFLEIESAM